MAGKFHWRPFSTINLQDPIFDSLKTQYSGNDSSPAFTDWFEKKARANANALVFEDETGIGAFICLKSEEEEIVLTNGYILPKEKRVKISTLKISERYRGQRFGEGAMGLILWNWQKKKWDQIYITVFDDHPDLISLLEKFGFQKVGYNTNGEGVYLHDRKQLDYSDPYKSFPFINPAFDYAGYLLIDAIYHDSMFPYSELKNTAQESVGLDVENGICKIYVGKAPTVAYYIGEPIFIYRIHNGTGPKTYKSCLTSYCVVTDVIRVKTAGKAVMSFDDLLKRIGNKSVYDRNELYSKYTNDPTMNVIEMLYYGYFGEGNNVALATLKKKGLWTPDNIYPTEKKLNISEFKEILQEAKINVQNVIID